MDIVYKDTKKLQSGELEDLFLSVQWNSGNYPEKLQIAMRNCDTVYTAWDENRLVGLMNCLSDGTMTAYFQYLLVRPEYQGAGIGKHLVEMMLEKYRECARKVLVAYDRQIGFYEKCGFSKGKEVTPMYVTYL